MISCKDFFFAYDGVGMVTRGHYPDGETLTQDGKYYDMCRAWF